MTPDGPDPVPSGPMDVDTADHGVVRTAGARRARRWVLGFAAWTLLVWATRIDNILADEALDGAQQAWRLALSASFVIPAVVLVVQWVRPRVVRSAPVGDASRLLAQALAWWTVVVWPVRSLGIVLADHDAAFVVVHLALAAVSIGLAAAVLVAVRDR